MDGFGKKLKGMGGLIAGAFTVGAIGGFIKSAVLAAEEAQAVNNVLVQVAKNTLPVGTNLGIATERMIKFADSQEVLLGIDGEIIKSTQAKLLGFSNLASSANEVGGVFDRSLSAAFDLAAVSGKDVGAMSLALGKALEDPLSALGGIAKGTVKFSESQQDMIRGLVESGDLLGAQEVILGVVEGKFGGAAEAAAKGSERFANAMENLMETAGDPLLGIFADLVTGLQPVLETLGVEIGKVFVELGPALTEIVKMLPGLLQAFLPLIPILGVLAGLFLEIVAQLLPVFVQLFEQLLPVILELAPILADVFLQVLEALLPVFMQIIEALMPIVTALLPVLAQLIIALAPVIITLVQAFLPLIEKILPHVISLIEFLTPILVFIGELIGVVLVAAVGFFIAAFENVQTFFEEFGPIFKNIFIGLQIVFANVINGMITGFENFINFFVRGFNVIIRAVNAVQRELGKAEFALVAEVKFGRVEVPELVPLAAGGIVTGPTSALIGEAGPEAVIPLSKMGSMGNTYNITINANVADARLGEVVVNAIKRYERSSGPVFASA
jgi:hypothetical protein